MGDYTVKNQIFGIIAVLHRFIFSVVRRQVFFVVIGKNGHDNRGTVRPFRSHYGADQVTMEARCYGFARAYHPFMVNTVVGFIGPEYLYDSRQVIRAGLEDHFMGKLTGIPMGCDCCYTNHMQADQNDIENLSMLLASAGVNYILGVPTSDDVMLNYQTNAYHDVSTIREILGLRPIKEFDHWLEKMGISENGKLTKYAGDPTLFTKRGGGI